MTSGKPLPFGCGRSGCLRRLPPLRALARLDPLAAGIADELRTLIMPSVLTFEPAEAIAVPHCVECGHAARPGEFWRLFFADLGEVAVYCPRCAEREFGERAERSRHGQV
jgi:hypothetical protein